MVIRGNNFHNCNLVWQIQHASSPRIEGNNVETCLIGFIVSRGSSPRIQVRYYIRCDVIILYPV